MEDPEAAERQNKGGSDSMRAPTGSSGRKVWRRRKSSPAVPDAARVGQQDDGPAQKARKRRKRRRGRKVFAPGATAPDVASPPALPSRPEELPPSAGPSAAEVAALAASIGRAAREPRERSARDLPAFAALDLGTNNCRLLVAVPGRGGHFRVVDAFSRIVRLGEGLVTSGRLADAAMDRAVEALIVCGEKLRGRNIRRARLVATEACRAAANGREFLNRVEREAGLKLEIIDRRTEARLAVSGCGPLVDRGTEGVVLFDIGGGSSEIALVDISGRRSPRLANHIVSWTSLPVGVVSLAERFGGADVTPQIFADMVADVAAMIERFEGRDRIRHLMNGSTFHLLGTSGTVTTLAGVHLGLQRYDRRQVDGLWLDDDHIDILVDRLLGWDFGQRVANPCIGADRADLVLAGCAILQAIRAAWPSKRLRVADRGLREGILSELMAEEGVWRSNWRTGTRP